MTKHLCNKISGKLLTTSDLFLSGWPNSLSGQEIRSFAWKFRFKNLEVNVRLGRNVCIDAFKFISIGSGTTIMDNSYLYADCDGTIAIGCRCSFNHNVYIGASGGGIVIGNNVLIGPNTVLRAADHVFADLVLPIREQGHIGSVITIEDNVWIGANCTVLKGVTIGHGTVVGAGSTVVKSLPPMSICVGNPARQIKSR